MKTLLRLRALFVIVVSSAAFILAFCIFVLLAPILWPLAGCVIRKVCARSTGRNEMASHLELTMLSVIYRFPGTLLAQEINSTMLDILLTADTVLRSATGELLLTEQGRDELRAAGMEVPLTAPARGE